MLPATVPLFASFLGPLMLQPQPEAAPPPRLPRANQPDPVIWTIPTDAPCYGSAACADLDGDGTTELVFGTYYNDEHLYVVNADDGSIRFKRKSPGGPLDASVLIHDVDVDGQLEILFADSAYGTVFCISHENKVEWTFDAQSGTDSPFAAADTDGDGDVELVYGTMVSVTDREHGGHVNMLDGSTGDLIWTQRIPGHVQSEPALVDLDDDGTLDVLVTNWMGDDKLRCLDGKDGSIRWSFDTNDSIYHGVTVLHDRDKPRIIVTNRAGKVWCLDANGDVVWSAALEKESAGSVFGPTTLLPSTETAPARICLCGRGVHLLDATTGERLWHKPFGAGSIARGAVTCDLHDDGVTDLLFPQGRRLVALRASDGEVTFEVDLTIKGDVYEGIDNAPLLLDVDRDGWLEAFVIGGRGLSNETRAQNYGRATLIRLPKAPARDAWTTFRAGPRRLGQRASPAPEVVDVPQDPS